MARNSNFLSENLKLEGVVLGSEKMELHSDGYSDNNASLLDAHIVWNKGTEALKHHLDKQIFAAWIKPLSILEVDFSKSQNDDSALVTLEAPNKFCRDHVKRHYGGLISSTLSEIIGARDTVINYKIGQPNKISKESVAAQNSLKNKPAVKRSDLARASIKTMPKSVSRKLSNSLADTNLNPRYNFSNFVVGGCNQFSHAVSLKVSDNLGCAYNPLFIYGGVGLGKTHLANAIGNAAHRRNKKVLLISSETFVSELIAALKSNTMVLFKNKLRSVDLLIVDDIQFLIGKERTQEEFFHTFNELYNRHKQIILTSDKLPQELVGLEERLRTRFASGLSADLQAPDFETRVAILSKKSETTGMILPEGVARLLAERIDTNVRELEGALNHLQALCSMYETNANEELAEKVLSSVSPAKKLEITTESIQRTVASVYNVGLNDLLGKRRTQNIAFARQVAMYLCRRLTACSYPEIGALFGGRDHSTVIHANKVIDERYKNNPSFREELKNIERML